MTGNIYLIGYRGAGKSSTAKSLSRLTGKKIISTDELFEERHGRISDFIPKNGGERFRAEEKKILGSIKQEGLIVDCGGGIIEDDENIRMLRKGIVFWLDADRDVLLQRLEKVERPSLTGRSHEDEIDEILERRKPLYLKASDFTISSDSTPEDISQKILDKISSPKIVPVISEPSIPLILARLEEADCDLAEVRLDVAAGIDEKMVRDFLGRKKHRIIATVRSKKEGGLFKGTEEERESLLKAAASGAEYVDVEYSSGLFESIRGARTIISWHDFDGCADMEDMYAKMKKSGADIIKIACTASCYEDNLRMFGLLMKSRKEGRRMIGIMMGNPGRMSRIYGPAFGSYLTFASFNEKTAPGQISYKEMLKLRRIM